jgi:hypothetical protein
MFPVALAPGVEIVLMKVLDPAVPAFALVAAFSMALLMPSLVPTLIGTCR